MKLTNRSNLPLPVVKMIEKISQQYSPGSSDITATGLIEPPRIGALKRLHRDEIVEDVEDRIYAAEGTALHSMLETAGDELRALGWTLVVEKRLYIEVDGWKVGAQIDLFNPETGEIQDYKRTTVYKLKDGPTEEHVQQLNIGAEILRQNGYKVNGAAIVAFFRDWSKLEYERDLAASKANGYSTTRYPEKQCGVYPAPIVPSEEVLEWIRERIAKHKAARAGELPECSPEERWARGDKYAVVKNGQKKAYRVHDTADGAQVTLDSLDADKYSVVKRPGESIRCRSYCQVKAFCSQATAMGLNDVDKQDGPDGSNKKEE